jgi:L-threonylcarbamoyladenylate synthase
VIIPQTTESLASVAEIIARGGVIAFRTDTFYGLGADPFNRAAVQMIRKLKGREEAKPILIVISDRDRVECFIVDRSPAFHLLSEKFWPGPLTLIGRAAAGVPEEITAASATVGVRLPDDDEVRALVRACGGALTATSANLSGNAPARTAKEAASYFLTGIDLIVDGGEVTAALPSTVLDLSSEPRVIREGAVSQAEIRRVLNTLEGPISSWARSYRQ